MIAAPRGARSQRARVVVSLLAAIALTTLATTHAQPLDERARSLLDEAAAHVEHALEHEALRTPDHGGWRDALALGRQALALDDHPDAHRFLGRTYALVGWSVRALNHFHRLLELGGSLDADPPDAVPADLPSRELYAAAASDLGFARAQSGDLDGAVAIYERWLEVLPEDLTAVRRLGAAHLERRDPLAALPYWQRLVEADPDDAGAAFHLGEALRAAEVGPDAALAFRAGVVAYEEGDRPAALEHFESALAHAPDFADAAVWAGRTALELAQPSRALGHWERAARLRPDDGGTAYFLRVARDQTIFGIPAAQAFHAGLVAYDAGEHESALEAFERAVGANERFTEAWVWVARLRQELGRYDAAVNAWEQVVRLDPEDERARYFLSLARQQRAVGAVAGPVFGEGVAAYESNEFDIALTRFREAVALDPTAVQAWVWLGRVYFTLARYEDAAEAYARAAALDPRDADIAFFAAEAARLARPSEPADDANGDGADDANDDGDGDPAESAGDTPDPEEAP